MHVHNIKDLFGILVSGFWNTQSTEDPSYCVNHSFGSVFISLPPAWQNPAAELQISVTSKGLKPSGRSEEGQPEGHSSASRGWSTLGKESPSPTHVHHPETTQELLTPARSPVFWGQLVSTFKDQQREKASCFRLSHCSWSWCLETWLTDSKSAGMAKMHIHSHHIVVKEEAQFASYSSSGVPENNFINI